MPLNIMSCCEAEEGESSEALEQLGGEDLAASEGHRIIEWFRLEKTNSVIDPRVL